MPHSLSKKDYNRFVAFAFASADMLIEMDPLGIIQYVNGAVLGFFNKTTEELEGMHFSSLIAADEQPKLDGILALLKKIQRIERTEIQMMGRHGQPIQVHLSCFHFGGIKDHIFFSINIDRDQENVLIDVFERDIYTGLFKKESFIDVVNNRIDTAEAHGEKTCLTLLGFPTLRSISKMLPMDNAVALLTDITSYLRSVSLLQDTAGGIGEGVYGLLHAPTLNVQNIVEQIRSITQPYDTKEQNMPIHAFTIGIASENLLSADISNTLHYICNTFASTQGELFNISSFSEGHQAMLKDLQVF